MECYCHGGPSGMHGHLAANGHRLHASRTMLVSRRLVPADWGALLCCTQDIKRGAVHSPTVSQSWKALVTKKQHWPGLISGFILYTLWSWTGNSAVSAFAPLVCHRCYSCVICTVTCTLAFTRVMKRGPMPWSEPPRPQGHCSRSIKGPSGGRVA